MKPRSRQIWIPATGRAMCAAAVVLLLAAAGRVPAQPLGGKGGGGIRADASVPAPSAPLVLPLPERGVFYSNLGLLESISREAANAIADSLTLPPGSAVTLLSRTPHEANWFVGNLLAEILAGRGYRVRISDWGPAPAAAAQADAGTSSTPSTAQQPGPKNPNKPKKGNQAVGAGGNAAAKEPAGAGDGKAVADTSAARPDSAQAKSASVKGSAARADSAQATPGPVKESAARPDSAQAKPGSTQGSVAGKPPAGGEPPVSPPVAPSAPAQSSPVEQAPRVAPGELPSGNVLDLRVVEFGVGYSDVGRKLLFGPVRFTRVGGVYVQVSSLVGPDGGLNQVLSAERHRVDRLSGSQRSLAEGASYPFSVPELRSPGLGRYIEPTVVVGIVGSLVYLFYANQSSK